MADTNFSSSNKGISISGVTPEKMKKTALKGMSKDVRKRWMIVSGMGAAAVALMATWASSTGTKSNEPALPKRQVVDTTPKGINEQKDWRAQTGAEILALQRQLKETTDSQLQISRSMHAMQKELEAMRREQQGRQGVIVPEVQAPAPSTESEETSLEMLKLPKPPVPPPSLVPSQPQTLPAPPPGRILTEQQPSVVAPRPVAPAPELIKRTPARSFIPQVATAYDEVKSSTQEYEKNKKAGFLPAGSFSAATLISGVEAFTGGTAQSQPLPVVIRLDANAILPNAAKYQIKGCHVLASVWGDMSSERVYGRLATLTCVDSKSNLVLSEEVEGQLVDSDGKIGIRGSLQDRQGAKLARSLLAGLAEGMSDAFGNAQTTSLATGAGITSAITGNSFKAAGYGGVSQAAEQLSEFYLKQAESTMPVIAVDAGRKISVMFTKSQSLRFESTDAYKPKEHERLTISQ